MRIALVGLVGSRLYPSCLLDSHSHLVATFSTGSLFCDGLLFDFDY